MRSLRQVRVVAAILAAALALTVAGPAAARQFDLNAKGSNVPAPTQPAVPPSTNLCSEVCSGLGYGTGSRATATGGGRTHVIGRHLGAPIAQPGTLVAHPAAAIASHKGSAGFAWLLLASGGGAIVVTVAFGLALVRGRRRTAAVPAQSTLAA